MSATRLRPVGPRLRRRPTDHSGSVFMTPFARRNSSPSGTPRAGHEEDLEGRSGPTVPIPPRTETGLLTSSVARRRIAPSPVGEERTTRTIDPSLFWLPALVSLAPALDPLAPALRPVPSPPELPTQVTPLPSRPVRSASESTNLPLLRAPQLLAAKEALRVVHRAVLGRLRAPSKLAGGAASARLGSPESARNGALRGRLHPRGRRDRQRRCAHEPAWGLAPDWLAGGFCHR